MSCEICEVYGATVCCSGLDVPMLYFCRKCAPEHAATCPEIAAGRARMEGPDLGEQNRQSEDGGR